MITQELFQSMAHDRNMERTRLLAERQVKALREEKPSVRRSQLRRRGRLPLLSFVVNAVWGTQAS